MKVAITGANGFVGKALTQHLATRKHEVTALSRKSGAPYTEINYNNQSALVTALKGHQAVIHLIGKTHSQDSLDALNDYRKTNVQLSKDIAIAAAKSGINTFIYLSSIKAMGESSPSPYSSKTEATPTTAYGISKLEAENELRIICEQNEMKLVILRPPLIYSLDAKGNIQQLKAALSKKIPLPFGSIDNRRSIVTLEDLCEIIGTNLQPDASNSLLLPATLPTLSTPQLINRIAQDANLNPSLIPFSPSLIQFGLKLLGKSDLYDKLCGNLEIIPNITSSESIEKSNNPS